MYNKYRFFKLNVHSQQPNQWRRDLHFLIEFRNEYTSVSITFYEEINNWMGSLCYFYQE